MVRPSNSPTGATGKKPVLHCLRSAEEVVPAVEELIAALQQMAFSAKECFGVRLALEEALVNGIKHGNQNDPNKEVRLWWTLAPNQLRIVVKDQGPGFDPEQVPDPCDDANLERPCGRGLLLMRACMTSVRFNSRGNCVMLCKDRSVDLPQALAA
jgi:serine/threonine-protein kinase RsbW